MTGKNLLLAYLWIVSIVGVGFYAFEFGFMSGQENERSMSKNKYRFNETKFMAEK